jgi:hypothetical protein
MSLHGYNWGIIIAWAGIILSVGSAIGYACVKDWRHALYFAFAAGITTCVIAK